MRAHDRKNHGQTRARAGDHRAGGATADIAAEPAAPEAIAVPPAAPVETLGKCPPPLDVPQEIKPLDATWRRWIADNALRRCSPESMLATVTAAGIDPAQASGFIGALAHDPTFGAAERMRDRHERFARTMAHVQSLRESAPGYDHVEKRSRVSRDEFIERYVRGCRPVVLTDLTRDWPAMQRWSFAEFKRRFGSLTVQVQAGRESDADFEINKVRHRRETNFAAFVDRILTSGDTNDEYLTANNELLRRPEFAGLLDEVGSLPDFCDSAAFKHSAFLWVGPAGTRTPLHHDTLMLLHADRRTQALALRLAAVRPEPVQRLRRLQPGRLREPRPAALPRRREGEGARRGGRARRDDLPAARVVAPGVVARQVHLAVVHQHRRAQRVRLPRRREVRRSGPGRCAFERRAKAPGRRARPLRSKAGPPRGVAAVLRGRGPS